MPPQLRVALLIESSRAYGRQLLQGIAAFGREQGNWAFFHEERSLGDALPDRLKRWRPDGMIVRMAGARLVRQLRHWKVPVVDLFCEEELPGIPGVALDQDRLVEEALAHFRERGFRSYAYCGFPHVSFSELREARYVRRLAAEGVSAHVFRFPGLPWSHGLAAIEAHALQHTAALARWLQGLPKPVGLWACNDMRGQQVLIACREAGLAVPDEVAVLGVDNDDVQCELSNPPLSSIDPNTRAIGYEAAHLLQRLLAGRTPPRSKLRIPPLGVVTRRSTDVLAIADPAATAAVRFIREHACDGMRPEAMLAHLKVSRSTLERWLQRVLGHSLTDEILRVRVNRVAELLRTTRGTVENIAHRTGFAHVESMSRIFKRFQGMAPGQYRRKFQLEEEHGLTPTSPCRPGASRARPRSR